MFLPLGWPQCPIVHLAAESRCAVWKADTATAMTRNTLTDLAGYLQTMVIGDERQTSSTTSESSHNRAQNSSLPNVQSTRARHPPPSATPTPSAKPWSSSVRPRSSSQHIAQSAAPLVIPSSHDAGPNRIHQDLSPTGHAPLTETDPDYDYDTSQGSENTPPSPRLQPQNLSVLSFNGSGAASPSRIKVRDLNHIQSFASEEVLARSRHGSRLSLRSRQDGGHQYEISSMPVTDIIEMVAGLLTKITTTNDRQHEHLHRHIPPPEGAAGLTQQATSVLAFHGKNVPSITILSYLSRIHKYCPTTYEVFLSLLVYFDRMTEMVNNGSVQGGPGEKLKKVSSNGSTSTERRVSISMEDLVDSDDEPEMSSSPSVPSLIAADTDAYNLPHFFVVDSFNIHRLVIAGVTCASKFFSDVFYTNSRYAKVCSPISIHLWISILTRLHLPKRSAAFPFSNSTISNCNSSCWTISDSPSLSRSSKLTAPCWWNSTPTRSWYNNKARMPTALANCPSHCISQHPRRPKGFRETKPKRAKETRSENINAKGKMMG